MQIQISWLLQKPTDLDLHCLKRQDYPGPAGLGLKQILWHLTRIIMAIPSENMFSNMCDSDSSHSVAVSSGPLLSIDIFYSSIVSNDSVSGQQSPDQTAWMHTFSHGVALIISLS